MRSYSSNRSQVIFAALLFFFSSTLTVGVANASYHMKMASEGTGIRLSAMDITGLRTLPVKAEKVVMPVKAAPAVYKPTSAPVKLPTVSGDSVWDRLAQCESGGNWASTGGSFSGGLQFLPSTWRAAGGTKYAPTAAQATREQQIAIAKSWLARTSWAQWPACSRKLGLR